MARLTDGKRTVEIIMMDWDVDNWKPDWSNDFFEVGGLRHDNDLDAYIVDDVDYCIEQAQDWKNGRGDFYDERCDLEESGVEFEPDDRLVDVVELEE